MESALITATWQAAALSALSNILGQAIKCYQGNRPLSINATDVAHFVLFAILSTPPNFWWQSWLEKKFPGYIKHSQSKRSDEKKTESPKSLHIPNTAIKFALDQTLGAAVNTLLFLAGLDFMRGRSWDTIVFDCREKFWPLMLAGYKLWPAVSLFNFTVVPVQYRTVTGSIVGLFWGTYLSLVSGSGN